ncbi:filamentous hemagglutinin N-terminal domain-containing protein [Moorena sp. SIO4G3]|uniref:two-partner secretion domain-containing protein n=1 Tax=Moorena sp. SIO4G3 TaxID=2607821 RepID=UPI00142B26D7|nr:filamentous hemagglutinin N-terminal domain-containing protein [Moorena sp. SIO4G3]NEO81033.1 S-layer family protein [Moorena sp. SIO4G3]
MQVSPFVLYSLLAATTALGQITPDNTLGNESSVVTPNVDVNGNLADLIEGGAIRESNLFHSFSDFNVAEFGRVYFANPTGIENILSRVTGAKVSNILGTLGVLGNANLFLINPNGIVFGPNSRLDLGGSFFGSTADSVLFEDGTVFSAKNPNEKPLLTINIPSGLQYGSNPGSITNQSSLFQVPNGETLGLIGGDITIAGGQLTATDGRIELGSVGSNGVVKLTPTDTSFGLDYSTVQEFQDISLSEGALVTTSGESGGSIQVRGANVNLRDRSFVFASTNGSGSGGGIVVEASQLSLEGGSRILADVFGSGQGGDLTVNATKSVRVVGVSANGTVSALAARVIPRVLQRGTGNGGDVSITTGQLIVSDGALVSASTFSEGDGGNLTVDASESVQVIGTSADEFPSSLSALTSRTGKAGDFSITTGQLIVSDGARVSASAFGEGDGGNLTVDASESVQVIGTSADDRFGSGLFTQANPDSKGNAGELSITTGQLIVSDGAQVAAGTFGEGDGGNLTVDASESVQLIGTSADGRIRSGLFNRTEGTGNAGELLNITTGKLIVSDGALVSASTFSEGDGGNLTVDASESVQLIGTSASGESASGLFAQANRGSKGNAGELSITTGQLIVADGAQVSAGTFGEGHGGILTVNASSSVQLIGRPGDGQFPSGLFAQTGETGNAGDLKITTGQLIISDGAQVSAVTFGEGHGGNLTVNAFSSVQLIGTSGDGRSQSGLTTAAEGTGDAGKLLKITSEQLIVSDGAGVSATSTQKGSSAGEVKINANSIFLNNNGIISAQTAGAQGNITLYSRDIRLLNRSLILTNARNTTGGNIEIDTDTLVGLGNSDITANAQQGRGGSVTINAKGIFGLEFRDRLTKDNDITSTSTLGSSFNGDVEINISQVDPTSGLTELPASPVDAEAILANDLCGFENNRIAGGSSFIITGKGGLPASADDAVINTDRTVGWLSRPGLASSRKPLQQPPLAFGHESRKAFGHESRSVTQPQPPQEKKVIIEAQGWVTAKDGTIILTAHPFRGTPVDQILPHLDCHSGGGR